MSAKSKNIKKNFAHSVFERDEKSKLKKAPKKKQKKRGRKNEEPAVDEIKEEQPDTDKAVNDEKNGE